MRNHRSSCIRLCLVSLALLAGCVALHGSTFLGGFRSDRGLAMTADAEGNIYITGHTRSADFPVTAGAYDGTYNGGDGGPYPGAGDVFVCKLDGRLTTLLASTLMGGTNHEYCRDMVLCGEEELILSVTTSSPDFPTTAGAYDRSHAGGLPYAEDAALVRMTRDLSWVTASTFLGGSGFDFAEEIAVDGEGRVFVTGWTMSPDFPVTAGAFDPTYNRTTYDAFVSRFDGGLSTLQASTFFGGENWDFGMGICLYGGHVYITGHTASGDLPTTFGAHSRSYQGDSGADEGDDAYVAKFDGELKNLLAATYLGGGRWENGTTVTCDGEGCVFVGGTTNSQDFPTTPGAFSRTFHGGSTYEGDMFITRMDPFLMDLQSSTYLGGVCDEHLSRLIPDGSGGVRLVGSSCSPDWPTTPGAFEETYRGTQDVVISRIDADLSGLVTAVEPVPPPPASPGLAGNYPNPFNSGTMLRFVLTSNAPVTLRILDAAGNIRRTLLLDSAFPRGEHRIAWDGRDDSGIGVLSGMYLCRLDAAGTVSTMKLVIVR